MDPVVEVAAVAPEDENVVAEPVDDRDWERSWDEGPGVFPVGISPGASPNQAIEGTDDTDDPTGASVKADGSG